MVASFSERRVRLSKLRAGRPVFQSAGDTLPLPPWRVRKSIVSE